MLPATRDPQTGQPLSALVRGPSYKQVGAWQELRLSNFPQLVERQVRILRSQHGPQVDSRGAYVDLVAINIYGGQGQTQVWIDDLDITGAMPADDVVQVASGGISDSGDRGRNSDQQIGVGSAVRFLVSMAGRSFPRIVEYQGEPLASLAELGFNGIRVSEPPSRELLVEAEQAGLWIVAPPPPIDTRQTSDGRWQVEPIEAIYDRVLAWSMGQELTSRDFERIAESAAQIARRPRAFAPLALCARNRAIALQPRAARPTQRLSLSALDQSATDRLRQLAARAAAAARDPARRFGP